MFQKPNKDVSVANFLGVKKKEGALICQEFLSSRVMLCVRVLVLFDGAGLARLGLEQAGHECLGVELNPIMHQLSRSVGSGNVICADATKMSLVGFDAIWASPPCQVRSSARTQGAPVSEFAVDYLQWCLALPGEILWVESVRSQKVDENKWGKQWNAVQFLQTPIQNRNRIIGGRYRDPKVFHPLQKWYGQFDVPGAITASEYKGSASDTRRASRWYGRRLTLDECAYHQGFEIPGAWRESLEKKNVLKKDLYEAIGNGVPPFMSRAFGECYKND